MERKTTTRKITVKKGLRKSPTKMVKKKSPNVWYTIKQLKKTARGKGSDSWTMAVYQTVFLYKELKRRKKAGIVFWKDIKEIFEGE